MLCRRAKGSRGLEFHRINRSDRAFLALSNRCSHIVLLQKYMCIVFVDNPIHPRPWLWSRVGGFFASKSLTKERKRDKNKKGRGKKAKRSSSLSFSHYLSLSLFFHRPLKRLYEFRLLTRKTGPAYGVISFIYFLFFNLLHLLVLFSDLSKTIWSLTYYILHTHPHTYTKMTVCICM